MQHPITPCRTHHRTIDFPLLQSAVEHGPPEGWEPPEPDEPVAA